MDSDAKRSEIQEPYYQSVAWRRLCVGSALSATATNAPCRTAQRPIEDEAAGSSPITSSSAGMVALTRFTIFVRSARSAMVSDTAIGLVASRKGKGGLNPQKEGPSNRSLGTR
jgi:hypothetical protein